jgi:hypothetical protein
MMCEARISSNDIVVPEIESTDKKKGVDTYV